VCALVPRETTLEEMAAKRKEAAEERRRGRQWKRTQERNPWMEKVGAHKLLIDAFRKALQRQCGVRIRPLKRSALPWNQDQIYLLSSSVSQDPRHLHE